MDELGAGRVQLTRKWDESCHVKKTEIALGDEEDVVGARGFSVRLASNEGAAGSCEGMG